MSTLPKPLMRKKKKGEVDPAVSASARAMNAARWKDISPEQRRKIAVWVASHGAGRPRTGAQRCPCGAMTLKLAKTRADGNGTGLGHKEGCRFFRDYRVRPR